MKLIMLFIVIFIVNTAIAQKHIPLPHGMVFGQKPDTIALMQASRLETFMGKKTRITTSITGKVIQVTLEKGGWFEIDAGNNRVIAAHFTNAGIDLPRQIAGRTVIISGIAAKQFIADDLQHMAGDTVTGKKQHKVNTSPNRRISFEVNGLMIDK
jgi:hypothetical protein